MVNHDLLSTAAIDDDASGPPIRGEAQTYFRWLLPVLLILALLAFVPLWPSLILAIWLAHLARPLHARVARRVGNGSRAAGVVTVLCVILALAPVVTLGLSLVTAALNLFHSLRGTKNVRGALEALLASEPTLSGGGWNVEQIVDFVRRHGGDAVDAASTVFGATASAVIGLFVFVYGFYVCLVDGRRAEEWALAHCPLRREHTARFIGAFMETGRGLLVGVALTALIQGVLGTVGFLLIGVPQALVLGLLTMLAALIPSVGTGLVWVPVAVGLYLGDRMVAALLVVIVGVVISVADNFLHPALARYAHLNLPNFVLFVAMLGGLAVFGVWGILAGPLFVRVAVEALKIWRVEREIGLREASTHVEETDVAPEGRIILHG